MIGAELDLYKRLAYWRSRTYTLMKRYKELAQENERLKRELKEVHKR